MKMLMRGDYMNEIILVNEDTNTVSARELHAKLNVEKRFSAWFETNSQGFVNGEDFTSVLSGTLVNNGAFRELKDYAMSIDMAKHICLMSRTEKGKQVRQYLIDLEKAWNTPEQVMARALRIADRTIASLKESNAVLGNKNKLLNKEILEWADRPLINALVRRYATNFENDYSKAWKDFKRELLYKYGININARITNHLNATGKKTKPKTLDMISNDEISDAICTAISLCDEHRIDISDILQNKAS